MNFMTILFIKKYVFQTLKSKIEVVVNIASGQKHF